MSPCTSHVFRGLSRRIFRLREKRDWQRARCLAYAAEADIAARRAVRAVNFPKTAGLAARDPHKAALLSALKARYNTVYQRIRYLEHTGSRLGLAVPRMHRARILREAWDVLLTAPAPLWTNEAIPLRGAPKGLVA